MKEYALTFARIVLGLAALSRGLADTFGIWGGPYFVRAASDAASSMGVSEDWIFYVVAIGLVVVGIALLLGLMVRAASLAILVVAVWYGIVNGSFGAYFAHKKGCEYLLAIAALCGVVASHGPGAYKLEIKRKKG